jgi:hypothetical protein
MPATTGNGPPLAALRPIAGGRRDLPADVPQAKAPAYTDSEQSSRDTFTRGRADRRV